MLGLGVRSRIIKVADLGFRLLWYYLHLIVSIWFYLVHIAHVLESYIITSGLLRKYKKLNINKLRYLAVVIDSDEAYNTSNVIELLQWLEALGVKKMCLYDAEGVLKKTKEAILQKMKYAISFEQEGDKKNPVDQKLMTIEFASYSDGKEAVAKAANLLLAEYMKLGRDKEDQIFTEDRMSEALRAVGCKGPEPDLLLVYGQARCHLGFPAWRMRYTEIVHMGPLESKRYGSLLKAIYRFTTVRQNYGT